ncbi:MAG: hypothetical protein ABI723_21130 [Bacteroidia bacterium]
MKKTVLFYFLFLFTFAANAQINIGAPGAIKPSTFKKSDMEFFQSATTYFVMRESDKPQQAKIESILNEVWKFNKIKLIDFDQYKKTAHDANSIFFGLRSYNYNYQYVTNADIFGKYTQSTTVYVQLWRNEPVKKEGQLEEQIIARINAKFPYAKNKLLADFISIEAFEHLCKEDINVPEWNLGVLKNYLQIINQCMVNNKSRWVFSSDVDKEQIKNLKKETLFIDDRVKNLYDSRAKESPLESYPYKHEFISMTDLSNKILESETPFYYMIVYIQGTDKMTNVVNSKTGAIIYSDYKGQAYFFKDKDVKNLVEEIGK